MTVLTALTEFMDHTLKTYPVLQAPFDHQWRSPCEIGEPFDAPESSAETGGRLIRWQPCRRHPDTTSADFEPLERALDISIHPDIKAYYGAYWSAGLEAEAIDGQVSLLFLWNTEDVARLNENLIGHALAKRQAKSPMTVFFACTEPDSELFLSVDNLSGAVMLEKPSFKPLRQVADDLASFLETLVPRPPVLHH